MKPEIKRYSLNKLLMTVPQYPAHFKTIQGEIESSYGGKVREWVIVGTPAALIAIPCLLDPIPTSVLFWFMCGFIAVGYGCFIFTRISLRPLPDFSLELNKTDIYVGDEVIANFICEKGKLNKINEYKVSLILQERVAVRRPAEPDDDGIEKTHYYYQEVLTQSNSFNPSPIHFTIPKYLPPSMATNSIQKVNEPQYKNTINRLKQELKLTDLSEGSDIFLEWALVVECKLKLKRTSKHTFYFTVLAPETRNQYDIKSKLEYF